jgi:flavin reductase (DIM6/NTAB) family NADH-FMN oxidoreductase RutF
MQFIFIKELCVKYFMDYISINEIKAWDRFHRTNFVNCLSGFKPVSLIGTVNEDHKPNLAIFSNIIHLGADPALIGFINRPVAASPHTITNIEATKQFTINHIQASFVKRAHQTSAKYETGTNEFKETGLTAIYRDNFSAPFVAESNIQYALELVEIISIKYNGTFMVIGSLKGVYLNKELVLDDGFIDIQKSGSVVSLGIDAYYSCLPIERYAYAKIYTEPTKKQIV